MTKTTKTDTPEVIEQAAPEVPAAEAAQTETETTPVAGTEDEHLGRLENVGGVFLWVKA